jgi:hypothetical protein
MSNIIGLGESACALAKEFKKYPQYTVYNILTGDKRVYGKKFYIEPQDDPEQYEAQCPSLKKFLNSVADDVLFIVDGSEPVSATSLKILSEIRECNITILYLKTNIKMLSEREKLNEQMVRGVLQEYARSAVFEKIIFVDLDLVGTILPNMTVKTYYSTIRQTIASTLHMIEIFSRTAADHGTLATPHEASRILTIGIKDFETGEENMFFPLDYPREKCYYYAINEEKLATDVTLLEKINMQISEAAHDQTAVSYGIYSTNYADDYIYAAYRSSAIQK